MQSDLKAAQGQIAELTEELKSVQRSKENLEAELDRLADETDSMNSFARLQRQYEGRISELEEQLGESELARSTANRIKDHLERQHEEIRQLILQSGKGDGEFQTRLLKELQLADEALAKEMKARGKVPRSSNAHDLRPPSAFSTPTKSRVNQHNPVVFSSPSAARADASTKQISQLKQQVQVLEIQMAASERVRKHLEISLREMAEELEKSDGSMQFLHDYKARLARENQRLSALLKEEGEARKAAESAHADGIQAIWNKFQKALDDEKQNYARLEESRKALLVQQRTAQSEIDSQKVHIRDLTSSKKRLQEDAISLRDQAEASKREVVDTKRQLQQRIQDADVNAAALDAARAELKNVIQTFKEKEHTYVERLEAAEIARAKAARAEATVRRSLADLEKQQTDASAERAKSQQRLQAAEKKLHDMQKKLQEGGSQSTDDAMLRQHLVEELEDVRERHQRTSRTATSPSIRLGRSTRPSLLN
ncbi:hypothetical protein BKA70DRAFT_543309 [Coprinopsis sp. MPI-PUGE-AT-0042]|nr:hypothetical protein BKA70DRAFT_543309 [Coprinopsis sp. MPI-PUGE-AT-0042]